MSRTITATCEMTSQKLVNSSGVNLDSRNYPRFSIAKINKFRLTLKSGKTAYAIQPTDTFKLVLTEPDDWRNDTPPLRRCQTDKFTVIDAANGIVEVSVDLTTAEALTYMENQKYSARLGLQINATINSVTDIICQDFVKCINDRDKDEAQQPTENDPLYRTIEQEDAENAKLLNKDFSTYPEKTTLADADILAVNDSENSGNVVVATLASIWTYISAKIGATYAKLQSPVSIEFTNANATPIIRDTDGDRYMIIVVKEGTNGYLQLKKLP